MTYEPALTLREAAFVFETPLKEITRKVEEHSALPVSMGMSGRRKVRLLGMNDLMYVQAINELEDYLTPKGRLALHEALLFASEHSLISINRLQLQVNDLKSSVEKRLETLRRLKDQVEGDSDDPFIKGTTIEVYRVGALFENYTLEEVQKDYPHLTTEQLKLAREYSKALPKQGRPYPKKSVKRVLTGLNFDALDEVEEQHEVRS